MTEASQHKLSDLESQLKLPADLNPETLTAEDINAINQFSAAFRQNVPLIDADLETRREIAQLLQVKVIMAKSHVNVSCILGQGRLLTSPLPKKYGRVRIPA
jgi:hypothetical protein